MIDSIPDLVKAVGARQAPRLRINLAQECGIARSGTSAAKAPEEGMTSH